MRRSVITVFAVCMASLSVSGCFDDPDIADVVDAIAWEIEPARLDPHAELRFGSGSLSLARTICGWVDDCQDYAPLLRGIRQAHVGVYEIDGRVPAELGWSDDLRYDLEAEGWHVALASRDRGGETILALTRLDGGDLTGLYVVSLEDDELVVVKLEGNLSGPLDLVLRRDHELHTAMTEIGEEF
jgi:hypothetical protein